MSDQLKLEGVDKKGYGKIPKMVMKDEQLTIEAKAIYAYFASYAGGGETAFPSIGLICYDLGISENRLFKHRKLLVERGYLSIEREQQEKGWSKNIYTLHQSIHLQNVGIRNEGIENEGIENEGTITNSTNNNSIKSNSINKDTVEKLDDVPYKEIVDYLNEKAGRQFRLVDKTKTLIKARWNEGQRLDDFKKVVDIKIKHANDSNNLFNETYLQPSTLFGNKFDEYRNQFIASKPKNVSKQKTWEEQLIEDGAV